MFRRRREKKTDYRKRLALLKSRKARLVVRRSLNNFHAQLIKYGEKGDVAVIGIASKSLKKFGWKGHCGNTSAAYLTGLLIGFKGLKAGIREAVLDMGLQTATKQNSVYALVKGVNDAGLKVPVGEEILPSEERISGKHIAEFAKSLKSDEARYKKQFSSYLKNSLNPEDVTKNFHEVKDNIFSEFSK